MSSRVLSGAAAEGSGAFEWRRVERAQGGQRRSADSKTTGQPDEAQAQKAEMERHHREAYEKGRREGEAAAHQKAAAEITAAREKWLRAIDELSAYYPRLRHEAERDIVKLGAAIARRILRRELNLDPGALLGIVKAALEELDGHEVQRVRVHPDNVALLKQHMAPNVTVVADPALSAGGLIFETLHGNLDTSVETQLQEIERGLTDLASSRP